LLCLTKSGDPFLAIFTHHGMAGVISIHGQVRTVALGNPNADREGDGNTGSNADDANRTA
jgi:hypothetical protein